MDKHWQLRAALAGKAKNEPETPDTWYIRKVLREAEEQWERDVRRKEVGQ